MRTVQMTLDETLVQEIDQVVKELGTTRSAFAREALRAATAAMPGHGASASGRLCTPAGTARRIQRLRKTSRSGASDATREVRWYTFARPDKRRPVVILTRDTVLEYLGEVTVAPVTSVIRDIPSEVLLSPFDGMPRSGRSTSIIFKRSHAGK